MLGAFGTNADGDTDADGATNVSDLLALLAAFGSVSCVPGAAGNSGAAQACSSSGLAGTTAQASSGRPINVWTTDQFPAIGDEPFTDRSYTFTSLGSFEGADMYYIQVPNNDKSTPSNSVMWTLNVPVPVVRHPPPLPPAPHTHTRLSTNRSVALPLARPPHPKNPKRASRHARTLSYFHSQHVHRPST